MIISHRNIFQVLFPQTYHLSCRIFLLSLQKHTGLTTVWSEEEAELGHWWRTVQKKKGLTRGRCPREYRFYLWATTAFIFKPHSSTWSIIFRVITKLFRTLPSTQTASTRLPVWAYCGVLQLQILAVRRRSSSSDYFGLLQCPFCCNSSFWHCIKSLQS